MILDCRFICIKLVWFETSNEKTWMIGGRVPVGGGGGIAGHEHVET